MKLSWNLYKRTTKNKGELPLATNIQLLPIIEFGVDHGIVWVNTKKQAENGLQSRSFKNGNGVQMTSEFIHEEISIMDYNGIS